MDDVGIELNMAVKRWRTKSFGQNRTGICCEISKGL